MRDRHIVLTVYPDAECLPSQVTRRMQKVCYAIFRVQDGVPVSNEWHPSKRLAWKDAADDINDRMLRKLEA
jgi:hypothetical protein